MRVLSPPVEAGAASSASFTARTFIVASWEAATDATTPGSGTTLFMGRLWPWTAPSRHGALSPAFSKATSSRMRTSPHLPGAATHTGPTR